MSNYLFNGFKFKELNSEFELKNVTPINEGETSTMRIPLLNDNDNGYVLNVSTEYNKKPIFSLEEKTNNNYVTLFEYDGVNNVFKFNKNIDLQSSVRIINNLDPINPQDFVTKSLFDSAIGGLGDGSVTSIGISTDTTGLTISNTPITTAGTININLSNQLQEFSSIGKGAVNQVLSIGVNNNFLWKNAGTVTSVSIVTSNNSGINISGSPITESGTIIISLSSNLTEFSNLNRGLDGQVFTMVNGNYGWITPTSGGNVVGSSTTTNTALAIWNNSTGTSLGSTNFIVDVNGNLNITGKKIINAADPTNPQEYGTKNYIDKIPHGIVIFTTNGTWTIPVNVTSFKVTAIGGGAGGGGSNNGPSSGGGGGAGGCTIKRYNNVNPNTVFNFVVGDKGLGGINGTIGTDGGNTIFNNELFANGGKAGGPGVASSSTFLAGGLGGGASGGDINLQGGNGGGVMGQSSNKPSGEGGDSYIGKGAIGVQTPNGNSVNGIAPNSTAYGAGGSGGLKSGTVDATGGNGCVGCVIIEW